MEGREGKRSRLKRKRTKEGAIMSLTGVKEERLTKVR